MTYTFFMGNEEDAVHHPPCDHAGCREPGEYPAPKSRQNTRERYNFCLNHVREYNKNWNYFAGFSEEQMYQQMRSDLVGERPTWQAAISVKMEARLHEFVRRFVRENEAGKTAAKPQAPLTKEAMAMATLGLNPRSDRKAVKARYRELVKRYHPDRNPDNPKAVERFKIVSEAYMILQSTWHTQEL